MYYGLHILLRLDNATFAAIPSLLCLFHLRILLCLQEVLLDVLLFHYTLCARY